MIITAATAVVIVAVLVWLWIMYNRMVRSRNRVEATWAQIDVQFIRRYELIPNLIATVKGYTSHERQTLDSVTRARSSAQAASGPGERAEAEQSLSGALSALFAVAEAYPDLKAADSFAALQTELAATEDLIARTRSAYNDAVMGFNTMLERVPMNIMAQMMGLSSREYFEVNDDPRGPVGIQF